VFYEHIDPKTGTKVPVHLIAYAPGSQISANFCEAAARDCPLVVLFHARPMGSPEDVTGYYKQYEELGLHLASYGYVAISVQWGVAESSAESGLLLEEVLNWIIAGHLGISNILSAQLVLIGHSNGGYIVDRSATPKIVNGSGFKLSAVVLMSPSGLNASSSNTYTGVPLDAFLVVHTVADQDTTANGGSPGFNPVSGSGVLAYELSGHSLGGNLNSSNPAHVKHLVYAAVTWGTPPDTIKQCPTTIQMAGSHFFQHTHYARSYVAAFLQGYVRHNQAFRSYFRERKMIPGMTGILMNDKIPSIWHMHSEPSERVLVDWASPTTSADAKGETVYKERVHLPISHDFSLNHGWVLRVGFVRGNVCVVSIDLDFSVIPNIDNYSILSFSVCQGRVPGEAYLSDIEGAEISLSSAKKGKIYTAKFVDLGGPLVYRGCPYVRQVIVDERVLPLSLVEEVVSIKDVDNLSFRFEAFKDAGAEAVLFMGNIKLIGKGP
jgi:hypothetical protein